MDQHDDCQSSCASAKKIRWNKATELWDSGECSDFFFGLAEKKQLPAGGWGDPGMVVCHDRSWVVRALHVGVPQPCSHCWARRAMLVAPKLFPYQTRRGKEGSGTPSLPSVSCGAGRGRAWSIDSAWLLCSSSATGARLWPGGRRDVGSGVAGLQHHDPSSLLLLTALTRGVCATKAV